MGDDSRPPATGYPVQSYPPQQHHHPSSAAYPYPQPQHQQPNPYFYNNNNYPPYNQAQPQHVYYDDHQHRTTIIRSVIAGMLAVFIFVGCVYFITWLVLRPKFPIFTIDSATVSGFNLSGTTVSGAWDFRLTVLNPNKKINMVYDEVESNLAYKSNSIAVNTLAPFSQEKKGLTSIRVSFAANGAYLKDKAAVALNADRSADGVLPFEWLWEYDWWSQRMQSWLVILSSPWLILKLSQIEEGTAYYYIFIGCSLNSSRFYDILTRLHCNSI